MITLDAVYDALQYMRNNGFWHCELFIKPDTLKEMMHEAVVKWGYRNVEYTSPVGAEFNRLILTGEPYAEIFGCPVHDMPDHTDNNADAVLCAKDKPYHVIVGKQEELGIFRGWLVP